MALILNIESTTTACSVGLAKDGRIISLREYNQGYSHAERLAPFIDEILGETEVKPDQLDAVAVSKGPGSYTGLRIGVAMAKGLCYGTKAELIAIPTLQSMCFDRVIREQVNLYKDYLLCPMIDARRMEVYTAIYDVGMAEVLPTQAKVLDEKSFEEQLASESVLIFGPGSEKFKDVTDSPNAVFISNIWPSAKSMALLAEDKFANGEFEDLAYFEPYYLKEFVATTPKAKL